MRWDKVAVVGLAVGLFAVVAERVAVTRPEPCPELAAERTLRSGGPAEGREIRDSAVDHPGDPGRIEALGDDGAPSTAFADATVAAAPGGGPGDPAPPLRTTVPEGTVGISDHAATQLARTTALPLAVFTLGTVLVGLGLSRHRLDV
jgi:hypothetical protein